MRATLNPTVRVRGTGARLPDRIVDNVALRELISGYDEAQSGPFPQWVDQVTHIHTRRFCAPNERAADLGLAAARQALEAAQLEAGDLGLIVFASFTPSQVLPGDHCLLAERLGAHSTPTFHLMAACAGAIYGMGLAYSTILAGLYEHVLIVGAETASRALNYADPITAIIFGDGAGAIVLSRGDAEDGGGMLPPILSMEYSARSIHQGNSNVPFDVTAFPDRPQRPGVQVVEHSPVEMEGGPSVLRRAVVHMANSAVRCLGYTSRDLKRDDAGLRETLDRAWVVPHQANGRIIDGLVDKLKVRPERVLRTMYEYGNISAASPLIALDYGIRHGNTERRLDESGHVLEILKHTEPRIRKGDLVLMPTIGGGYLIGCAGFVL